MQVAQPSPVVEPPPAQPPVVSADSEPPAGETPRATQFPPPPGLKPQEEVKAPKPPSPRTVGLVIGGLIILVVAGLGYLLFLDPLGLFKDAETPQAAAPTATPPAASAPAQPAAQPAPAAAAQTASPEPGLIEEMPEFTMPPPAPLAAGEEIAPGVVRLPPDADGVSAPEPRAYEPPAPKANPAYTALVNNLNISGIRPNSSGGFLMVGTLLHRPGDIVDQQSQLEFVGIEGQVITFKDPAGAIYTRRF